MAVVVSVPAPTTITVAGKVPTVRRAARPPTANIWLTGWSPVVKFQGDAFADPIVLTGDTGQKDINIANYTTESGEPPTGDVGTGVYQSCWFAITPTAPSKITLDTGLTAVDTILELYQGYDDVSSLTLLAANDDSTTPGDAAGSSRISDWIVGAGSTYYIRVRPKNSGATGTVSLRWALVARTFDLQASLFSDTLDVAPGTLKCSVLNGDDSSTVFAYLMPDTVNAVASFSLNDQGTIQNAPVPVSVRNAGDYTLRLVNNSRQVDLTYHVTNDPEPTDVALDPDQTITVTPGAGVQKWQLIDPNGLGTYVFPINPSEMQTPYAAKALTFDHTTSVEGQILTWEGAARASSWSFSGYLDSEDEYIALRAWTALNRRFYLVDHFLRKWVVSFEKFDAVPLTNMDKPWAHHYTVEAIIYEGPL